jgi:hypothetical protein
VGQGVQALTLGVLLGLALLQSWALLRAPLASGKDDLARKGSDARFFRYQAY